MAVTQPFIETPMVKVRSDIPLFDWFLKHL